MEERNFKVLFIYPNTQMATLVPINISLLSSCLKERGFSCDLFDTTFYKTEDISFEEKKVELLQVKPFNWEERGVFYLSSDIFEDLKKKVKDYKPDLIAITLVEDTFELGMSLLDSIKEYNAPVIAGGVFVTFSSDIVMRNKNVDMVCVGEGEYALVELCERINNKQPYTDIPNLWIKQNGEITKNPMRKLVNINDVPYIDYELFGRKRLERPMQGKIYTMIHVEVDRGCPYDCTYCEAPHLRRLFKEKGCGIYYRRKAIDRIIEEMKHLVNKYNPDYVNFNSETFLAKPVSELREFADKYKEIDIPFWCQSRPETVTKEKIKILKEMNCQNLQFGIECGNEKFREKVLNRRCSNSRMLEAFKIVEQYKINYTVNNMIGFPDETRELIFETIEFNRQIKPTTMNCYMFTPYRGTRLYQYCIEKGYITEKNKVHQVLDGTPLKMSSISYEELKGLQRVFSLYARFPKELFDKIRIAEKFNKEGNIVFEELRKLYTEKYFK